jgi:predicted O-methyltransferase YrrM
MDNSSTPLLVKPGTKMAFKQSLRKAVYKVAPRPVLDGYHYLKIVHQARRLSALRKRAGDPQVWIEALWRSHFFRPLQKRTEIFRLVDILERLRPTAICEIGAAGGGTTFLLAHAAAPDALIVSLDLAFTESRKAALKQFALPGQKLVCLQKNSHELETVSAIESCLTGRRLDVLYLDGDHSYEGIKADFELFSPLVKPGGVIVFHDIVPDYKTRYGIETTSYVGGVPQFWTEIKSTYRTVEEVIENPEQDGFGIGILQWSGGTK